MVGAMSEGGDDYSLTGLCPLDGWVSSRLAVTAYESNAEVEGLWIMAK